jgi:hypothetical protein
MLNYGFVQLKRLLVLLLVIGLAWFTFFKFFPALDSQLPFLVALLITYGFLAYIGIPALLRVRHLIQPPTHVPTRTIAGDGWALDPINLVVVAKNERQFVACMQKAGWVQPDPLNLKSCFKMIGATVLHRSYPAAPFSSTYVFGRKQDLAFQIQINGSPKNRHHVRFWRLGSNILEVEHEHHGFWRTLLKSFMSKEKQIWVGAASLETGINLTRRTLQVTHRQHGNTDTERDFLVKTLAAANVLKDTLGIKAGEPLRTRYQGFRETIIADGYIKLCEIKRRSF